MREQNQDAGGGQAHASSDSNGSTLESSRDGHSDEQQLEKSERPRPEAADGSTERGRGTQADDA